jgi:hypothetical protein
MTNPFGGQNLPGAQYPGLDALGSPAAYYEPYGMPAKYPMQAPQQAPEQQGLFNMNDGPYGGAALPGTEVGVPSTDMYANINEDARMRELFEAEAAAAKAAEQRPMRNSWLAQGMASGQAKDMSKEGSLQSLMAMAKGRSGQEDYVDFIPPMQPGLMGR